MAKANKKCKGAKIVLGETEERAGALSKSQLSPQNPFYVGFDGTASSCESTALGRTATTENVTNVITHPRHAAFSGNLRLKKKSEKELEMENNKDYWSGETSV